MLILQRVVKWCLNNIWWRLGICSSELTPHEQRDKVLFLLPDICTPKENNLNQNSFLGSKGRMDVAYANPWFQNS
jgi:hypothetical protein